MDPKKPAPFYPEPIIITPMASASKRIRESRTTRITTTGTTSEPKTLAVFQFFGFFIYLAYKPTNRIDWENFYENVGYGLKLLKKQNSLDVLVISILVLPVVLFYLFAFLVVFGWSVYYLLYSALWGLLVGVMGGAVVFGLGAFLMNAGQHRLKGQ
ncbi:hypothetical protein TWF788_009300 [Orbilia oligospora]|uniref:Uncharacterized protein n=1 Tax=Orbilia oligospora TaxID=2813651 RepID=A0A7C8PMQ6_ORBOL|nr:hypothetical protein TWF788_009300 [Orbilia oligospora]